MVIKMKKFLLITLFSIKIIQPQWQMLDGPYETCEVTNLFTHPNGTMFAGSDDPPNGIPAIFRSLNSGSSWSKVSNNINIRNDGVKSIASDPQGNIYVGSWGEFYYSSDSGDNWTTKNLYHSAAINSIVFNNLGNIFFGTSGISPGIYRSEIGGNIWTLLLNKQTCLLYTSRCV